MLPPLVDRICRSVSRWDHSLYPCVLLFVDIPSHFDTTVTLHQDRFCSVLYAYMQMNRFLQDPALALFTPVFNRKVCSVFCHQKKNPKNQDIKYPCSFVFHSLHSQTYTDNAFPSRDLNLKQHKLGKCLTPQLYSLFSSPWILIVTVIIY